MGGDISAAASLTIAMKSAGRCSAHSGQVSDGTKGGKGHVVISTGSHIYSGRQQIGGAPATDTARHIERSTASLKHQTEQCRIVRALKGHPDSSRRPTFERRKEFYAILATP